MGGRKIISPQELQRLVKSGIQGSRERRSAQTGEVYREEMTHHHHLDKLVQAGQEKGFEVEQNKDYGAGPIDVVWNIDVHSALPNIKYGFVKLGAEEGQGASQDTEDNQLSLHLLKNWKTL
jgi:hypothetical protein